MKKTAMTAVSAVSNAYHGIQGRAMAKVMAGAAAFGASGVALANDPPVDHAQQALDEIEAKVTTFLDWGWKIVGVTTVAYVLWKLVKKVPNKTV